MKDRLFLAINAVLLAVVAFGRQQLEQLQVRSRLAADRGQATTEYALVLLGAAAVALVLATWAAKSGKISGLLDKVIGMVTKGF